MADLSDDELYLSALRAVWRGEVGHASTRSNSSAQSTPREALLRAQAAFLLATLSGDKEAAGSAVEALQECSSVCKRAEAPESWSGWMASWVVTPAPQEATSIHALSEL